MSQSPTAAVETSAALNYIEANHQTTRMMKSGKSFSGHERNCCFLNAAGGGFANISAVSGLDFSDDGRAVGIVDWDHDGDLDLWLVNRTGPQVRFMRNDALTGHGFVALRLEGRECNRDAIGARVEVKARGGERGEERDGGQPVLIRTLHAGSGFLSQSSKWVHFGLGEGAQIEQIVVHWPGGAREQFTGVATGGRYRLVEGSGNGVASPDPARQVTLEPSQLTEPQETGQAHVWLAARAPLPAIEYEDFAGRARSLEQQTGHPLLLNLWASWCAPCLAELSEFARHEQRLRDADLSIVALSVDALGDQRGAESAGLVKHLERIEWPFDSGLADSETVDKLELLFMELFNRRVPLPVPASFLIDRQGRLAAVYFGPVSVERLLGDIEHLSAGAEEWRRMATPFAGRWHASPPGNVDVRDLAAAYTRAHYVADSIPLYRSIVQDEPNNVEAHNLLGASLAIGGDDEAAIHHYRQAVGINPDYVLAQYNLGIALARQGQTAEAVRHLRTTVELTPDYFDAHLQLADQLETQTELAGATTHFREAVRLDPRHFAARYRLGRILARQREHADAAEHFRAAVDLQPEHAGARRDLGIVLGRLGDMAAAIEQFRASLAIDPGDAKVHVNLGAALAAEGNHANAIDHYRRAMNLQPDWPLPAGQLAWLLATSRDESLRDPEEAVRLAEGLLQASGGTDPRLLETQAAAYAAAGEFDRAIELTERAIASAREVGDEEAIARLEQMLELFRRGEPHLE